MKKGDILKDRIGEENTNYQGVKMKIINYRRMDDIDVLFLNGNNEIRKTRYDHFKSGRVKCYSQIIGQTSTNKYGDTCVAVGIIGNTKVKISFEDGVEEVVNRSKFNTGRFARPQKKFTLSDKEEIPSHKGYYVDKEGFVYNSNGLQLKPVFVANYSVVSLPCKDGKIRQFLIHRLIAETFIPNPENKPQVNHKDGNKLNNNVENLEWATASENQKHRYDVLLHSHFGEKNTQSKLIPSDVVTIVELHKKGWNLSELSKKFGVSPSTICGILKGDSWSQITNIPPRKNIERMKLLGLL